MTLGKRIVVACSFALCVGATLPAQGRSEPNPLAPATPGGNPLAGTPRAYQPPPGPQVDPRTLNQGGLETLIPGIEKYPAPAWLRPGMRLLYTGSDSVTARVERPAYWDDKAKKWKTAKGEDWWSSLQDRSAGVGYITYDVAALTTTTAALAKTAYHMKDVARGLISPAGADQVVGLPAAAGGLWIHPEALRTLTEVNDAGVRINRGPWAVGQVERPAVMIQTSTRDTWRLRVFDLDSGHLLVDGSQVNVTTQGVPGTQSSRIALVNVRQMDVPWAGAKIPDWATKFQVVDFTGSITSVVQGMPPIPQQSSIRVEPGDRVGDVMKIRWTRQDSLGPGVPANVIRWESLSGGDAFLGFWTPSEALAKLKEGQVLDQDPVLKVSLKVAQPKRMPDGRVLVMIARNGPGFAESFGYDAQSGLLSYIFREDTTPLGTLQTVFSRAGMR
jgi:hypothetical protein